MTETESIAESKALIRALSGMSEDQRMLFLSELPDLLTARRDRRWKWRIHDHTQLSVEQHPLLIP